jgi:hypothetical protein
MFIVFNIYKSCLEGFFRATFGFFWGEKNRNYELRKLRITPNSKKSEGLNVNNPQ